MQSLTLACVQSMYKHIQKIILAVLFFLQPFVCSGGSAVLTHDTLKQSQGVAVISAPGAFAYDMVYDSPHSTGGMAILETRGFQPLAKLRQSDGPFGFVAFSSSDLNQFALRATCLSPQLSQFSSSIPLYIRFHSLRL